MTRHIKHIMIVSMAVFGLVVMAMAWRMLIQSDELSHRRYTDARLVQLMENLIDEGVIVFRQGEVKVLSDKFLAKYPSKSLLNRVKQHSSGVYRQDGRLVFDKSAASIINPAYAAGEKSAMRGRIFDRNGRVLAGFSEKTGHRIYPCGAAALHPVGYASQIYANRGIEQVLDKYLDPETGKPWWRYLWRGDGPAGSDVRLSLAAPVQKAAYKALEGKKGAVVAIEPETGDILALASSPAFAPNTPAGRKWTAAGNDPARPFFNRAIEQRYPPGSLFKLVVAAAGLEDNHTPEMVCPQKDRVLRISDRRFFGEMNWFKAITVSCNVYFARLGVKLGPKVPEQARKFGFMQKLDILPGFCDSSMPIVPGAAFAWSEDQALLIEKSLSKKDIRRNPRLVAQGSIGQNIVAATPLQMAMVGAAVANKAQMMAPRLVLTVGGRETDPELMNEAVGRETAAQLTEAMTAVMEKGTGRRLPKICLDSEGKFVLSDQAGEDAVQVAGKSGTAEVEGNSSHAWFLAFAPAKEPEAAVCVFVENGGWGSGAAGPVAVKVLAAALNAR